MEVEGIFRRSANALEVNRVRELFNAGSLFATCVHSACSPLECKHSGENVDFNDTNDVHLPAVLIKSFFR
jgi:hypothetical protein